MPQMPQPNPKAKHIVVLGYQPLHSALLPYPHIDTLSPPRAGITGLQTALCLLEAGYQVTIVAEHAPGDESAHYTSPW